ncbi:MAG: arginine deiminase [Lachnospiraceae bacterium]|nr:arginine deiminase [Lachnospiraceae bacterium]
MKNTTFPIQVKSETGLLKKVLLHRPGGELERLVPGELERLLFDDIPYLRTAVKEHDAFADLMRENGTEVVYLEDLAAEALRSDSAEKARFVRQFIEEAGPSAAAYQEELYRLLMDIGDEKEMILKMMSGVGVGELEDVKGCSLTALVGRSSRFALDPIPNLYFTRDPFACVGNGVILNHMYSGTRRRETLFGALIFRDHPDYRGLVPLYYDRHQPFSIEGGDVLVLNEKVIAVGISQRTQTEAIEILAANMLRNGNSSVEKILAFYIPDIRAFMHLDTVLTQLDKDKFLIHPEILGSLRVFSLERGLEKCTFVRELREPLEKILDDALGLDQVCLIKCGGGDRVTAEREQWNDGSNVLCIRPGTVIAYDRNRVTNDLLREHGVEVLEIPSSELSRGRGGPRCMSMPLVREEV